MPEKVHAAALIMPTGSSRPRSVPVGRWSSVDQSAWKEATRLAVRLQRGGTGSHLRKVSQGDIANRYGLYLDFLQRRGLFDQSAGAADLVQQNLVQAFLEELKARVSSVTVWNSIYKLRRAAQLLAPDRSFEWLVEIEKDVALVAEPRDKGDRLVLAYRILEAGLTLIEEAESFATTRISRARGVRNGLMIVLLALFPLRIKNFATLSLGNTIRNIEGHWWLVIDVTETKTRRRDERKIPDFMTAIIDRYITEYRPILLGGEFDQSAFWISSTRHTQFTIKNMGTLISNITRQTLGVDVSPHLFRMAAASTSALEGGAIPHLASAVLGHRDKRITEEHYNRAGNMHAAVVLAEIIAGMKSTAESN